MTSLDDVPLSVLDLVPVTSGASAVEALRRTVNLAQHAERLGFHWYWIAEHHNLRTSAATTENEGRKWCPADPGGWGYQPTRVPKPPSTRIT
ncbi:LLM class flavin-dependent oxidoreductase [Pseudonocardia sp. Cha107L01]|uniref:LLM class flavin-dependent oxidoreductase n=1 Tax=Pseudonocardia sp. Cha107L01 TaxID=3457576 RepID=UPI00403E8486